MIKRKVNLLSLVAHVALVSIISFGQQTGNAPRPNESAQTSQPRFEELRVRGFEALYNLDYEEARRNFRAITREFADHPAGAQFLAATLWLETLNESRRLQTSVYNSDSFYVESNERVDPQTLAEFRELTRTAENLAEARVRRNANDSEARYFLGAIEALRAAFASSVERRFTGALREGSRAVEHHRAVVRLDPNFHDAELTIGLYDYIVGDLPLPVKILASLTGVRGSKRRGIQTLERVAREGRWARDDARVILIALYKRENRLADALAVLRELAARYPRNYLFSLEIADTLTRQAEAARRARPQSDSSNPTAENLSPADLEREAFAIFDALLSASRTTRRGAAIPVSRAQDLIHFRYGEALIVAGQYERAAREYLLAAAFPNAEPGLATMSRLRAAHAFDLSQRRNDALAQYRAVLARPDVYDAHRQARRGLEEPYRR
jgi:hypothetical protein